MARILFLGRLADSAEASEWSVDLPQSTMAVDAIRALIGDRNPYLAEELGRATVRVAVNGELVLPGAVARQDDEIAFLPPVSGG